MAKLPNAMLEELCFGIHILQSQDNQKVSKATDLFAGMRQELEAQNKWISDNTRQILAVKVLTQTIEKGISMLTREIDEVNTSMVAITTSSKSVPSKRELLLHAHTMEEQMVQVPEMNTGLTTAMEGYKLSESSPYNLRRTSVTAGPSGTQYVHP
jgi:hypothetical protein